MKVCIVGDFSGYAGAPSGHLDEGYKNTAHYLVAALERQHEVRRLNAKHPEELLTSREQWTGFQPDVIHLISQPTGLSLMAARCLRCRWPRARVVISALRPRRFFHQRGLRGYRRWLLSVARPDLVLVQSSDAAAAFKALGCTAAWLPNGVDLHRFHPADPGRKQQLRRRYGLDPHRPIVLHVGHLEPARNLLALQGLIGEKIQVVVAGSLCKGVNQDLIDRLTGAGYRLFKGHQRHIEHLYMASDCYAFPPKPGDSLAMPLSVLEAMACDLPVVTTRFPGLVEVFPEHSAFRYVDDAAKIPAAVQAVLASQTPTTTRAMVRPFSWTSIVTTLHTYYHQLLTSQTLSRHSPPTFNL